MLLNKFNSKQIDNACSTVFKWHNLLPFNLSHNHETDIHDGVLSLWTPTDSQRTAKMHERVEHGVSFCMFTVSVILNDILL